MTDQPPPFIPPYVKPTSVSTDAAEIAALRVIVMACVTHLACNSEKSTGVSAQAWVNDLSTLCQESILASDIGAGDDRERNERFSRRVLDHINRILGGIRLPSIDGDKAN